MPQSEASIISGRGVVQVSLSSVESYRVLSLKHVLRLTTLIRLSEAGGTCPFLFTCF